MCDLTIDKKSSTYTLDFRKYYGTDFFLTKTKSQSTPMTFIFQSIEEHQSELFLIITKKEKVKLGFKLQYMVVS